MMGLETALEAPLEPHQAGTVFVIEDRSVRCESASSALQDQGFSVQPCKSLDGFFETAGAGHDGCVIVEGLTPGMSGLALLQNLAVHNRWMPVIILTDGGDVEMAVTAIKMGATDVIARPFNPQSLVNKVLAALRKGRAHRESEIAVNTINERIGRLTPREREVMGLVVSGLSNKSIARQLGIAYRTVEVHRAHLMEKMRVRSSADLIRTVLAVKPISRSGGEWQGPVIGLNERAPDLKPAGSRV